MACRTRAHHRNWPKSGYCRSYDNNRLNLDHRLRLKQRLVRRNNVYRISRVGLRRRSHCRDWLWLWSHAGSRINNGICRSGARRHL